MLNYQRVENVDMSLSFGISVSEVAEVPKSRFAAKNPPPEPRL
jgi:hypothetical protein